MDLTTTIYAAVVLFVAYMVRGVAGFGSGLISVPLLALRFPVTVVVPLVVFLDFIGSASQGLSNWKRIAWRGWSGTSSAPRSRSIFSSTGLFG